MVERSPIIPFLERQGFLLLDGGLATELEARGHVLDTALWSAQALLDSPDAVRQVHLDYLAAGAQCITAATYQASLPGFVSSGLTKGESVSLLQSAVMLATEARAAWLETSLSDAEAAIDPLVAASVGPYGAYLANGSEYRGDYTLSHAELLDFHAPRWQILAAAPADLLACETLPSYEEAAVLLELLEATPETWAWFSFSCRDDRHISDGTPLADCAAMFADCDRAVALGVNCTAPEFITPLIEEVRRAAPGKPVVVYPNAGEAYDAGRKSWSARTGPPEYGRLAREWLDAGATLIGGCCRVGPAEIAAMRAGLDSET